MANTSDLKKDIAFRDAMLICKKVETVTAKYHMAGNLRDELMQIASCLMTLTVKISKI